MPKPLLFPLELYNHPEVEKLNATQAGLFRLLIERYWKTGLPLPETENALIRSIKGDYGTFKRYGGQVLKVIEIVMPAFVEARSRREKVKKSFQINAHNMRIKAKAKRQPKTTLLLDKNDSENFGVLPTPPKPEYFHPGFSDPSAREIRRQQHAGKPVTRLKDK